MRTDFGGGGVVKEKKGSSSEEATIIGSRATPFGALTNQHPVRQGNDNEPEKPELQARSSTEFFSMG